ncbi:MAG: multicopper oxidase domain-containing protein, partial [Pseudomonadota bacterium]
MISRRTLLQLLGVGGAGLLAGAARASGAMSGHAMDHGMHEMTGTAMPDLDVSTPAPSTVPPDMAPPESLKRHPQGYLPVRTLNGWTLPYRLNGGVKEFHLVAEEIVHEFAPGSRAKCWGYNGTTPGPTIEAVEGDRVRIFVTNRLGEWTSVHWHGIDLPAGYDGVGGL